MLPYPVLKKNSGFSLTEMIAVVIIVGIIAAIAAPNLLGMLNRQRVNEGITTLENALKEAQQQATKNGQSCTINISTSNNTISGGCLLSTRNLGNKIELEASDTSLQFSSKGNIVYGDSDTDRPVFIIYPKGGNVNNQKCLVIQSRLVSITTGDYPGTIPNTLLPASCQ